MSTKIEEKRAFERLRMAFPDKDCSLNSWYTSWSGHKYHVTVPGLGSNIGECCKSADEAVDSFIKSAKDTSEFIRPTYKPSALAGGS